MFYRIYFSELGSFAVQLCFLSMIRIRLQTRNSPVELYPELRVWIQHITLVVTRFYLIGTALEVNFKAVSVLIGFCFLNNFCAALVSVHNCLPAIVYILDRILPSSRPPTDSLHAIASFLVLTTGICLSSFPSQFVSVSLVPPLLFF
jgi:hypothetical protein